jgi:hypothetical protein
MDDLQLASPAQESGEWWKERTKFLSTYESGMNTGLGAAFPKSPGNYGWSRFSWAASVPVFLVHVAILIVVVTRSPNGLLDIYFSP